MIGYYYDEIVLMGELFQFCMLYNGFACKKDDKGMADSLLAK